MNNYISKYRITILFILIFLITSILRIYKITAIPPSLHGDELGVGYNAYSLLKTGKDEYGFSFPYTFRNDFSPFIFYITIPSVALFGLNELSTKLPSLIISILTTIVIFFVVYELLNNKKIALLSFLVVAIATWQVRTSRIALEMNWALFFQMLGILLFLKAIIKQKKYLIPSLFIFGLSVISYQTAKITTPLIILGICIIYKKDINYRYLKRIFFLFLIFILFPILLYFFVRPLSQMRFLGISVFTEWKNSIFPDHSLISITGICDLIKRIIVNYISHFNPILLFFDNSKLRYYQLNNIGLLYIWQIFTIPYGLLYAILNFKNKAVKLLIYLLFISPLAAALTTGVPYANYGRALLLLPLLDIFSVLGFVFLFKQLSKKHIKYLFLFIFSVFILLNFLKFLFNYFNIMPNEYTLFWGEPLKMAIPYITNNQYKFDKIIITNKIKQPYMYYLFYGKIDPKLLFSIFKNRDSVVGYNKIGKFEFRKIDLNYDLKIPNSLIIGLPEEIPSNMGQGITNEQGKIIAKAILNN